LTKTSNRSTRSLALVVLAAGEGKRLRSSVPKVLHPICGKPALWHAITVGLAARPTTVVVVTGHGGDEVRAAVRSWGIDPEPVFVEQTEQLGTGHAVLAARRAIGKTDDILVIGGDFDPIEQADVQRLAASHRRTGAAVTTAVTELDDPGSYGRVLREGTRLVGIAEFADATPQERSIREVWLLVAFFRRDLLLQTLPSVGRANRQAEHYLNDVFPLLLERGERITALPIDTGGAMGANSRAGLANVERVLRDRINARHLAAGVTLTDPATTYIDIGVAIGRDTVIRPMTFLEGETKIGKACVIGPSTRLADTTTKDGCEITFSVVEGARLGARVDVGPYARLRPGTVLGDDVHVGTSVEIKGSTIGRGTKVPHLTYLGDADVGENVNVGAATITANWNGYGKHRTVIGDGARTGSDTILVAPVEVGPGAVTGAGSVVTKDVPEGALAVERTEQRTVEGYRRRKDTEHAATKSGSTSKSKSERRTPRRGGT
jgi:bifunctional UDP-N-acetylglucosamine pyrophosphorylase/glucosamine-1-phosphate N-acetyltransferase